MSMDKSVVSKTIPAGEFKQKCLRIMEEVSTKRVSVLITKRGRPLAKLVPAEERPKSVFGCMAGTAQIIGDIEAPLEASKYWGSG